MGESQRQTGVRFADVAGIDAIKDEIKVVMDMLLGAREYQDIGARPFRVRAILDASWGRGKEQNKVQVHVQVHRRRSGSGSRVT